MVLFLREGRGVLLFFLQDVQTRPLSGVKFGLYSWLSDQFDMWFRKLLFTSFLDVSSFKNVFKLGLPYYT